MTIRLSAVRKAHEFLATIFLLVSVSFCGAVRAQPTNWQQYPATQQYPYQAPMRATVARPRAVGSPPQMFQSPAQGAPASGYHMAAVQPYYVASRPVTVQTPNPMPAPVATPGQAMMVNQYPVTSPESAPYYQGSSQAPYAPSEPWNNSACQGDVGYGAGYCGGEYGSANCGVSNYCCPPPTQWFGYAGVLMLDRDDENHRFYSYDSNNEAYQLLDSQDTNFNWAGGVEAHVGRMDMCSCTGCEAVYWGLYPDAGYAYAYPNQVSGDLNGIFNFDQLDYNGQPANNFVDGAAVHRLYRTTELHNFEFNHIWNCGGCCGTSCCATGCDSYCDPCCANTGGCHGMGNHGCGGPCTFGVLTGFRYLRFEDNISFASDPNDTNFTGEADELYYNIDCDNDLWGWQFAGFGQKRIGSSGLSLTCGAKAGVFLNDADARSTIGGSAGLATINNGPNQGVAWDIESNDDCVATIAELQAGIAYAFAPTWRVRGDYRVIGISGVALPTNQIYQDLRGVQDVALISTNGDLILHGVFVGIERTY